MQVSGIKLSLDITEVIDNISIYIDKHKLEQVIRNFMTNAIKFTPNNGRITIRCLYFPILREDIKLTTSSSTNLLESLLKNGPNELPSLKGFSKNSIVSKEETQNLLEKRGKIRFEVQDTGAGISKVFIFILYLFKKNIFIPFLFLGKPRKTFPAIYSI